MKLALLVTLALASAAAVAAVGSNYAVLVAGSNGYYNYRHQADVCHAFHVLTEKGNIPKENIIVMMYDDIASSPSNPVPGTLINHPNGTDVYKGVNKDYTGDDVTPENFLAVLSGNSSGVNGGSGRVLNSGPEDNVFVYFSDHGATGLVAFPSTYLYANDLISTLKTMHANKKYKELVFYLEACESGSMFDSTLPENINIYATTASSPTESSYACYYDASRGTYLGDEYSVRWMEDADTNDKKGSSWTLKQQFVLVQNQTLQSGVHQYGNLKQQGEKIREFEGNDNTLGKRMVPHRRYPLLEFTPCGSAADSRDVKIKTLLQQRAAVQDENGLKAVELDDMIAQELHHRAMSDLMVDSILMTVSGNAREKEALKSTRRRPSDFECLKSSVEAIEASCGKFSDYSLKYVYTVVNMCESGYGADFIAEAARQVCEKLQF